LLQLLNPIWLFTLAGITIPLIIHLWNVKKGKTLKVGSISLLGESSRQNAKSLKLMNLLLLFLRCLLLIILTFILAKPIWNSLNKEKLKSGWIILEEENKQEIYSQYKSKIDSLIALGYKIHYFEPDFREIKITEARAENPNRENKNKIPSYWSLLNLLNDKIPANTEVFLFTSQRMNRLGSERAQITFPLSWETINPADSLSTWLEHAWFQDSGTILTTIANSSPTATTYSSESIDPTLKNSRFVLDFEQGMARVNYKDTKKNDINSLIIDTSSIKIAIYSDKFKHDARYIKAAIGAIKNYSNRKIELREFALKNIPSTYDIIFWLSDTEIPTQIKAKNILFTYTVGEIKNVNTQIIFNQNNSDLKIELYKRVIVPENQGKKIPIWEDGFGNPILSQIQEKNYTKIEFYSRFNPEWNELVWSEYLPKALMSIVLTKNNAQKIHPLDKRNVSTAQMAPIFINGKKSLSGNKTSTIKKLDNQFWLTLILVFMLERYLSYRKHRA